MKINLPVITPTLLFSIGSVAFGVQAIANAINFFIFRPNFNLFSGFATWFMIFFNIILALFFWQLKQNSQKEAVIDEQIEKMMKE